MAIKARFSDLTRDFGSFAGECGAADPGHQTKTTRAATTRCLWTFEKLNEWFSLINQKFESQPDALMNMNQLAQELSFKPSPRALHFKAQEMKTLVKKAISQGGAPQITVQGLSLDIPLYFVSRISRRPHTIEKFSLKNRAAHWTQEEDEKLLRVYQEARKDASVNWENIAMAVGRDSLECKREISILCCGFIHPYNTDIPIPSGVLHQVSHYVKNEKKYSIWFKENTVRLWELFKEHCSNNKKNDKYLCKMAKTLTKEFSFEIDKKQCHSRLICLKRWGKEVGIFPEEDDYHAKLLNYIRSY